jgi:molybdopterin molybdotransferase
VLLALDDAVALIRETVPPVAENETVPLSSALGRVLAQPITAPRSLPPFDNTAVDGYAFRRADASDTGPARLPLTGESAAGIPFSGTLPAGAAIRISTGAVLPDGADTVAMQEDCRREDGAVVIDPVPALGANLRHAGADIRLGDVALAAGTRLQPQDISLARALGLVDGTVKRRLKIAIAATGEELREGGADLGPGQIVETNALMLSQLLAHLPVDVAVLDVLPDNRAATEVALADAGAKHDLVITTGGVSVGDHDHVRPALLKVGQVHFWRLAIRPGKPVLFGQIGKNWMVGLPGNPVSAFVTFLIIVRPVIEALLGMPPRPLPGFPVPLAEPLRKAAGLRDFQRARLDWSDGTPKARPYADQGSNLLTSIAWADGLLDLPVDQTEFKAGDTVIFRPFGGLTT